MKIKTLDFNAGVVANLRRMEYGTNWPVVYIIHNKKEAYIGETIDASIRANQHLSNDVRKDLKRISIISDDTFNKSVVLDLESFLIKYMAADQKFQLQNGNSGLQNHNYYQREMYQSKFKEIWKQLNAKGIVQQDIRLIENSDLFKYSPYKSLTADQYSAVDDILNILAKDINQNVQSTFMIYGSVGTGKTILAIYMMKLLSDAKNNQIETEDNQMNRNLQNILKLHGCDAVNEFKIGLVIPMNNLRTTLKRVFREIKGLNPNMVLSPNDVGKQEKMYDLLIIDESHRLRRRKNLTQYKTFDNNNIKMNLGKNGTELDWILLKSKYQLFFYDDGQTIRPTDVRKEDFDQLANRKNFHPYFLETQLRCMAGGNEYVRYVKDIFSNKPPKRKIHFEKYDFKIFDDVNDMIEEIKRKDKKYGLCRNVAGYAWPWKSKGKKLPMHLTKKDVTKIVRDNMFDLEIDGHKYVWNIRPNDWIHSRNSIHEIGSIHTTQGYDLNYTGLIIGNDLRYDKKQKKIIVDRKNYFDIKGKAGISDEELLQYLLNIYSTMCTRGILGTYLYVCDDNLREYMKKYVESYSDSTILS